MRPLAQYRRADWLLLYAAAALALLLGIYARFKGLGLASMAPDEYYIARSVENVLRYGIPEYQCGGYYPRALVFQYVVAALAAAGMSIELSARVVAAVASVAALPAVYWLGRRAGGRAVGIAAVAILALSVWEVELARFGRMYAPFQAIFVWYLVFFVKLTVDQKRGALWPLLALTVLGGLTWEGGAFLALANLTIPFVNNSTGRLVRRDVLFLALNVVIFVAAYGLLMANLRLVGSTEPQFPADFDIDAAREVSLDVLGVRDDTRSLWSTLTLHPLWMALALLPLALVVGALRFPWSLRARWPAALVLSLALVLAVFQQFAAAIALIILLPLLGMLRVEELRARPAKLYLVALAACLGFWLCFGLATSEWRAGVTETWLGHSHIAWLVYELVRLPNIVLQVVRPWSHSIPVLGLALGVLLAFALVRSIRAAGQLSVERVLMLVLVCMLLVVGASEPPRQETRYVFFLYPVAIILALALVVHVAEYIGARWRFSAAAAGALVCMVLFLFTEDFQPRHLASIDSIASTVRLDVSPKLETHLVPRTDVRGAAQWVAAHAVPGATLVISAFPSVDYYYSKFDFTFIDQDSPRFRAYACRRGTFERWGNLPLVHSMADMQARIEKAGSALMVVSHRNTEEYMRALTRYQPRVAWTAADGEIQVLALSSPPG